MSLTLPPDSRRDFEEFTREIGNFKELCRSMGNRLREVAKPLAGLLYVLEETVYREAQEIQIYWGQGLVEAEPPTPVRRARSSKGSAAGTGQPRCRHEWGAGGVPGGPPLCVKCRHPKGPQGRKAAGAPPTATVAGVTKEDPPSRALPLVGDERAHAYGNGGAAGANRAGRR